VYIDKRQVNFLPVEIRLYWIEIINLDGLTKLKILLISLKQEIVTEEKLRFLEYINKTCKKKENKIFEDKRCL